MKEFLSSFKLRLHSSFLLDVSVYSDHQKEFASSF